MKRSITLGGRAGTIEFQFASEECRYRLAWDGEDAVEGVALLRAVEPGIYSVLAGSRSFEVKIAPAIDGWAVDIAGRHLLASVHDPRDAPRGGHGLHSEGRQSITSPIPGRVVRVLVEQGDTVEAGQGLVVVEAMKMQNEMKAPKAGKVVALAARAGATVGAGDVLVTLE